MALSIRTFFALSAAALAGCTTICATPECRLEETARLMLKSDDVGVQATGARTLTRIHGELSQQAAGVREDLVSRKIECTVQSVEIVNGVKVLRCPVERKPEAAVPAPAPAPAASGAK